ncbi:MAG: fumarylacetoacetate hydrolase family protein [Intrasporangium sp.]|uniref:fumarylacetoacetate hydrolase family protein n=1 Tax=Intrasporangium sp. TaxID=1925024 RepID=UPI002647F227|nr:fumarylacetoacetate hydrolase family protein [Intrasporangium sp.]MDN5798130.1 fumarylacetoacetate hydrolase family protein [Intrasporangium sp.]
MKWLTFHTKDDPRERVGVIRDGGVAAAQPGATMIGCFGASRDDFAATGQALLDHGPFFPMEAIQLAPPIPRPPSVRDFMMFEEHVINASRGLGRPVDPGWYKQPVFYFTNPVAIAATGPAIPVAPGSENYDYELELATVIGWPGANVPPEAAEALIAGYCLFIDWSARDLQGEEMKLGLGPAKGKDTATTLGPVLVTPDELEPYRKGNGFDLTVSVNVNDQDYGTGSFANMYWSFSDAISYAARGTKVVPGDVFGSGTCGRGCILELQALHGPDAYPWVKPGDLVTVEAQVLGSIANEIVAGPRPHALSRA